MKMQLKFKKHNNKKTIINNMKLYNNQKKSKNKKNK